MPSKPQGVIRLLEALHHLADVFCLFGFYLCETKKGVAHWHLVLLFLSNSLQLQMQL